MTVDHAVKPFELGLYSFVERTALPQTGQLISPAARIKNLLEEIALADQVGLDVFGVGEHHRDDYLASSPATLLAAAAAKTTTIRLSSAVTVLSSDDPVRVFQDFATLDLISAGRAEIMVGRGSFIESFPLFGYDLNDYDALFEEKLDLLLTLQKRERVSWQGLHRPAIENRGVYPRPLQDELPVWLAVGGTPASVVRAARLGLPLALAIIGGMPERFAAFTDLYHSSRSKLGLEPLPVSINSHGYLADSTKQALTEAFPAYATTMNRIGKERGWPPLSREQFDASAQLRGANFIGTPDEIIEKILFQHEVFKHQRFMLQISVGTLPHQQVMHAIELYGTKVAPVVREEIASRQAVAV